MKRIAIIGLRGFPGIQGGVEKHCEHLVPLLTGAGERLECVVYRRKPYLTADSSAAYPGIRYVDLPSSRIKGVEALLHTLLASLHLLFHRVDAVNVHNIGPGLFIPLLRLWGYKVVLTYHSPNYEHKKWNRAARALLRLSERVALTCASRVIFVNRFQMQKYPDKIQRKSQYIPNGVDAASPSSETDLLTVHGIIPGEYILAVGRITPEKGFSYLIEAVNRCESVRQLVIAGGCDHDMEYFRELQQLDTGRKVIFTGQTNANGLRQLYSNARMFVLSSVNEGFPLVMLESMSYGLPMTVTDIPATRLVDLPADNYVKAADADALAAGINAIYSQVPHRVNYDLREYDWDTIADRTLGVYRSLFT